MNVKKVCFIYGGNAEGTFFVINSKETDILLHIMFSPYLAEYSFNVEENENTLYILNYGLSDKIEIRSDTKGRYFVTRSEVDVSIKEFLDSHCVMREKYYFVHGAVVSYMGKGILLLGKSGAGKSTLTAYLSKNGFRYATDDKVIIACENRRIYPFTRSIQLREDVIDLLRDSGVDVDVIYTDAYMYQRYEVANVMSEQIEQIDIAIYLDRMDSNNEFSFIKMKSSDAIQAFLWSGYLSNDMSAHVRLAIDLSRRVPVYQMSYRTLDAACLLIKQCIFY